MRAFLLLSCFLLVGCTQPAGNAPSWCFLCGAWDSWVQFEASAEAPSPSPDTSDARRPVSTWTDPGLSVRVVDSDGQSLDGAGVMALSEDFSSFLATSQTGADGRAKFAESFRSKPLVWLVVDAGIHYRRDAVELAFPMPDELTVQLNRSSYDPDVAVDVENYSGVLQTDEWLDLPHGLRLGMDGAYNATGMQEYRFSVYDESGRWIDVVELPEHADYEGDFVFIGTGDAADVGMGGIVVSIRLNPQYAPSASS